MTCPNREVIISNIDSFYLRLVNMKQKDATKHFWKKIGFWICVRDFLPSSCFESNESIKYARFAVANRRRETNDQRTRCEGKEINWKRRRMLNIHKISCPNILLFFWIENLFCSSRIKIKRGSTHRALLYHRINFVIIEQTSRCRPLPLWITF